MADTVQKIPLTNTPQRFDITLGARALTFACRWNDASKIWQLDIYEGDTPLVLSLPIVAGCDLWEQYAHLDLGGMLAVYTDGNENQPPTLQNLGVESNLYWVPA